MCHALLPFPFARSFFQRWRDDAPVPDVARQFGLSVRTVQRLFARFATRGRAGIDPGYRACGQNQPQRTPTPAVTRLCRIRQKHPGWGSEMIRLEWAPDEATPPAARTIRRHLHRAGLHAAPGWAPAATRAGVSRVERAGRPHQGWQMDACEYLRLANDTRVCWLRVVDECTGAYLQTVVVPHARWEHVCRHRVQGALRRIFERWGLPQRMRVDNGYPWGNSGDFPPELALWLVGLGIEVVWIRPACPQQNGVVERSQDVGRDWFEPQTCTSAAQLQRRCDALDQRQRERYPYQKGRSRLQVYPGLAHSARRYRASAESRHWDVSRVHQLVSEYVVTRQVDCNGNVSVYNRGRYVGKAHIGTRVFVSLDPSGPTWVIADAKGTQLRAHRAEELSAARIRTLCVTARKGKRRD
jgi:integrase-like protein